MPYGFVYDLIIQLTIFSLNRLIVLLTVAALVVLNTYAPPAIVFLHPLQFHIPTAVLFTASLPQNVHVYVACCDISIFFTCFRSDIPYRVPYFPVTPTFFVLRAYVT